MTTFKISPPLRGDGRGKYRINIVGNSGSGKTTLGGELATILDVPFIQLDVLFWKPGWEQTPTDELREKVVKAINETDKGWIVDGNYQRRIGTIIEDNATDVIWLDPPLLLYLPRLCYRTFLRLLRLHPPCRPGCEEMFQEVFFSKESIIWWCISQHWVIRKREEEKYRLEGIHVGGNRRRIGGWGSELQVWKDSVREMVTMELQN
ncbi:hypothetical protein C8Q75DRAFT_754107 [Abortiporus biennis]|nr:hypothetical protein C8Q75DRAFT_754107 [Abortiporus biennis]